MDVLTVNIAIGTDHAGFLMKEYLKKNLSPKDYTIKDYGTDSEEPVDYPDIIHPLAKDVDEGIVKRAVILCGSGNGAAMVANKYRNVRAAVCWTKDLVKLARKHNDANVLVLPARILTNKEALEYVKIFCSTAFEGGRHLRRVNKISANL
jgi:ribose 5-phosphate isomerase B